MKGTLGFEKEKDGRLPRPSGGGVGYCSMARGRKIRTGGGLVRFPV